jgi:hypothetical protein
MKVRTHLRVAKTKKGARVEASAKPNYKPLISNLGSRNETPLPTAMFALDLDLPDEMFTRAEQVLAEVSVDPQQVEIAAEIATPEGDNDGH